MVNEISSIVVQSNTRRNDLDFVGGILIVHMVLLHIFYWAHVPYESVKSFLFFFMQWFFFKNGMFFKKDSDLISRFRKDFHRLLIPFISFSLLGQLVYSVDLLIMGSQDLNLYFYFLRQVLSMGFIAANAPLWFLLSLFIVRFIYNLLTKSGVNSALILLVSIIVSYICYRYSIISPRYLANSAVGMTFFILGGLLKDKQYEMKVLVVALVTCIIISFLCPSSISLIGNELLYGDYLLSFPYALSAIILVNGIARSLSERGLKMFFLSKMFCYMGRNSMFFFVTHWIVIVFVHSIVVHILQFPEDGAVFLTILLLAVFIVSPLLFFCIKENALFKRVMGN